MGSGGWGLGSVAKGADEAGDEFAGLDTVGEELGLLGGTDEMVVEQDVGHGAELAAGASGVVVGLAFFSGVEALQPSATLFITDTAARWSWSRKPKSLASGSRRQRA